MKYTTTLLALLIYTAAMAQNTFDIEAHRGGRGLMPENTIPAFLNATKMGVNTLEMDIVMSKDSLLVVSHDPYISAEICSNPNGSPVTEAQEKSLKIYDMTYAEIKKYDCGARGNSRFPDQKKMSVHKPLLSEVIDAVEAFVKEHNLPPVRYNIETKSTVQGDNVLNPEPPAFVKLFYAVIKSKGVTDKCILQSFDPRTLQEMHTLDPTIPTALLVEKLTDVLETNIKDLHFTPTIYSPAYLLVTKKMIDKCHAMGMKILPWTVNEIPKMISLKNEGVDGLITDYPDRAIKALRPK
jgi:glycerophosphoryl diester phosphodiesterase